MAPVDDHEATLRLFRETLPELYAFVARRCGGDRSLAEDVTQEAWLRAIEAWRRNGPPREPVAWLKTTAANLLCNELRSSARRERSSAEAPDTLAAPAEVERDDEALRQGLGRLPHDDARLIEQFHVHGASTRELARERGASERAIEGRLRRARLKLREFLERRLR
jgi:RNA polymerase sigma-70 factor (ECF subfamily)